MSKNPVRVANTTAVGSTTPMLTLMAGIGPSKNINEPSTNEITPPTVQVSAFYPGANPQVVAETVAAVAPRRIVLTSWLGGEGAEPARRILRDAAIAIIREIGVEAGGCNVQFAVSPTDGELLVIEMNPRVSRSSALASKATGFPIAKIAAKLAVGYTLDEIQKQIDDERRVLGDRASADKEVLLHLLYGADKGFGRDQVAQAKTRHGKELGKPV